jgi:hypothetical protein
LTRVRFFLRLGMFVPPGRHCRDPGARGQEVVGNESDAYEEEKETA